jgi:hypothetical protein
MYQSIQTLISHPKSDAPHLYVVCYNAHTVGVLFLRPKRVTFKSLHGEVCSEMETRYQESDALARVLPSLLERVSKRFKYDTQALVFAGPLPLS